MVTIIDGWYFRTDEHQYILIHQYMREKLDFKTRKPTGEMVEKSEEVGYFSLDDKGFKAMINKLSHILIKEKCDAGTITTMREYLTGLRKINKMLYDACKM